MFGVAIGIPINTRRFVASLRTQMLFPYFQLMSSQTGWISCEILMGSPPSKR